MAANDCPRQPTAEELAGMQWWNSLSETERADALNRAGDGSHIPSAADAWALHKKTTGPPPRRLAGTSGESVVFVFHLCLAM
jgi:hypothetical protein